MASSMSNRDWCLVTICLLCTVCNIYETESVDSKPQVDCFFIFGDSLADNGNNNNLITLAKVNYHPYGVDFSAGATGRFTNGRTTVDILGELLGLEKTIQSFASSATSEDLLSGVNYASGAAGILPNSGKHMGDNISFRKQVENHGEIVSMIGGKMGNKSLEKLKKCLYWIGMGNNDYINNYFMPNKYPSSSLYSPQQFASLLIEKYHQQVLELYKYGARMVAFDGLGQIGCTPNAIATYGTNGSTCVRFMNDAVKFFNKKLIELVDELNLRFSDAKFIYINSFGTESESEENSLQLGFSVLDAGCCEVNGLGQCVPNKTPCQNRSEYVFWDSFHTTEAFNILIANKVYKAQDTSDCYPMDISSLVKLFGRTHDTIDLATIDVASY